MRRVGFAAAILFLAAALLLPVARWSWALDVPPLTGRVVDLASMISPQTAQRFDAMSAELERTDSTQVVLLTIPSLRGEVLEEYSVKVAQAWGLGRKDVDNGVLLLVAKAEREVRIEVGYGLEGRLTDLMAGRIVDTVIVPRFKTGDFDGGVLAGLDAITKVVRGEYVAQRGSPKGGKQGPAIGPIIMFLLIAAQLGLFNRWVAAALGGVVAAAFGYAMGIAGLALGGVAAGGFVLGFILSGIFSAGGPRSRGGGGPWIGSSGGFGGGGGDFGGGGFSGGGGGFGGGGASGRW